LARSLQMNGLILTCSARARHLLARRESSPTLATSCQLLGEILTCLARTSLALARRESQTRTLFC
ncbi:hypothetical protein A2U01_0070099, partial [Trifolium medium]|nr:hypothetical protein [Trifolium medium]